MMSTKISYIQSLIFNPFRLPVREKIGFRWIPVGITRKHTCTQRICWKCNETIQSSLDFPSICPKCGTLQKYKNDEIPNHFQLLGQDESFDIDIQSLSSNMKKLQKRLHPDLFTNSDEDEQQLSQNLSSHVNDAIATLQNPILRGFYLLGRKGIIVDIEKQQILDPNFLTEVLELNEELEEVNTVEKWSKFRQKTRKALEQLESDLKVNFDRNDLKSVQSILAKMKYYENLMIKLKDNQSKLGIIE